MMANFFDEHSPYLAHPLLTDERTRREVDLLLAILELAPEDRVLDVGCAFGRHTIEFARRGYPTVGIDPSLAMVEVARARAGDLPVRFASGFEDLGLFDGAIMMFTTLGQVDATGASNEAILAETARHLRPGSKLVIEVPQREAAVAGLVTHDHFEIGSKTTTIERSYDDATRRVIERFVVTDGATREFDLAYRLFDRDELVAMLDEAGVVDHRVSSSLEGLIDGASLTASDPTMLISASMPS